METRPRRHHFPFFKAKMALFAVRGDEMLAELAPHFYIHPQQITQWRSQLLHKAIGMFGGSEANPTPV